MLDVVNFAQKQCAVCRSVFCLFFQCLIHINDDVDFFGRKNENRHTRGCRQFIPQYLSPVTSVDLAGEKLREGDKKER